MGQKTGKNRKFGRRFWAFIGALWLVTACLTGCAVSGETAGDNRAVQVSEGIGDGGSQESTADREASREKDRGNEPGIKPDTETEPDTELHREAVAEPEDSQRGDGDTEDGEGAGIIEESGFYTSKDEVASYLHLYGRLPDNYITKRKAEDLGWNSKEGNLWEVAPGMSIGGSRFGNYEGALPDKEGRKYFECDIDYEGGYRGAKRLIYSDDGLIFYTEDHYNTFEQLYGE